MTYEPVVGQVRVLSRSQAIYTKPTKRLGEGQTLYNEADSHLEGAQTTWVRRKKNYIGWSLPVLYLIPRPNQAWKNIVENTMTLQAAIKNPSKHTKTDKKSNPRFHAKVDILQLSPQLPSFPLSPALATTVPGSPKPDGEHNMVFSFSKSYSQ